MRRYQFKNNRDLVARAVEMWRSGMTQQQVADAIGKSRSLVSIYLTNQGIDCVSRRKHRVYTLDEKYFSVLDAERAYWLGFLLADGHMGKKKNFVRVVLQRRDEAHLQKFASSIQSSRGVTNFRRKQDGKIKTMPGVELCSVSLCRDLDALGFSTFKRGNPQLVAEHMPKELINHFLRGVFDGDGSVSRHRKQVRVSIIDAHETIARWLRDQLAHALGLFLVKLVPSKRRTAWKFTYGGNAQATRIAEWLYADSTICLNRKHDRFIQWLGYATAVAVAVPV